MEKFIEKLTNFLFGKHLKLVLMLCGIGFCVVTINPYRNPEAEIIGVNIRYSITGIGLILAAIYLHIKDTRNE